MHNNLIDSKEIESLISPAHNAKYQVLLNNKVMNEYLEQNQSKIRCPFCDQIFDVNVQPKDAASDELSPRPSTADNLAAVNPSVKCPNCLESFCATCHIRMGDLDEIHICEDLSEYVLLAYST